MSAARLPPMVALAGRVARTDDGVMIEGQRGAVALAASPAEARPLLALLRAAGAKVATRTLSSTQRQLAGQLLQAGVLTAVVPAPQRLSTASTELRRALAREVIPAQTQAVTVLTLGELGSPAWEKALGRARGLTLPIHFERELTWVGPLYVPGEGPCPRCLALRRWAATGARAADPLVPAPRSWLSIAGAVLGLAQLPRTGAVCLLGAGAPSARRVLGVAACPDCRPGPVDLASKLGAGDAAEPGPAAQEPFYDPLLGPLLFSVGATRDGFRDLPLVVGGVRTPVWSPGGPEPRVVTNNVCGSGFTFARRRLVQFAEGLERLALMSQVPELIGTRSAELGPAAVDPGAVAGFAAWQRAEAGFELAPHREQPLEWSRVHELLSGQERWLPFDALVVGRGPAGRQERLIDEPYFTGGAVHVSPRRAVGHALLELIERDAFMLTWYLRLPLPELELGDDALSPASREVLAYLGQRGVAVRFFDMSIDFDVPVVLALARAQRAAGRWPAGGAVLSGCAGTSAAGAVERAVGEVLGQYTALACLEAPGAGAAADASAGMEWLPAFERYLKPSEAGAFEFLGRGRRTLDRSRDMRAESAFHWLLPQFAARKLEVLVRWLEAPELRASGLSGVKVVVPTLVRPARTRLEVNFGSPRFAAMAERHGVPNAINPLEHPVA